MSKPGYKSVSLKEDLVDMLIEIGKAKAGPIGSDPSVAEIIEYLVTYYNEDLA
jgi:hypothetical protein